MTSTREPFDVDRFPWSTDFDHVDPNYNTHAPTIWNHLRRHCPVAHTSRYGGMWLPVRHRDIEAIARDTDHFSSAGVVVSTISRDDDFFADSPVGAAPPITSDPPAHRPLRQLLLPAFSPHAVRLLEDDIRRHCRELLDLIDQQLSPAGSVIDVAAAYTQHIPVRVIAHLLGLPADDGDRFREFIHDVIEAVDVDPAQRVAKLQELGDYIANHVTRCRDDSSSPLITTLITSDIDGEPLTTDQIVGIVILLLVAGIDTTWSAIGSGLWHLATHPDDLTALTTNPDLWPTAIEELLRAYAPVTIGTAAMHPGDWVLLPFPAANRDPDVFPDADTIRLDRAENRHASFGLGIHRCLGSNLARLELTVALQEFVARYPHFGCDHPHDVTWSVGQVRGPRHLPLRLHRRHSTP